MLVSNEAIKIYYLNYHYFNANISKANSIKFINSIEKYCFFQRTFS